MEHTKHTPGPWTVNGDHVSPLRPVTVPNGKDERGNRLQRAEQQAKGIPIARVMFHDHEDGAANARLIAAAPELLAALRDMLEQRGDYLATAQHAIAKATGQQ
jgi:hypothetical protein